MSDLTEALDELATGSVGAPLRTPAIVFDYARRWDAFPSDEDVAAAARAFLLAEEGPFPYLTDDEAWHQWWTGGLVPGDPSGRELYAEPMRAALLAVKAREDGGSS